MYKREGLSVLSVQTCWRTWRMGIVTAARDLDDVWSDSQTFGTPFCILLVTFSYHACIRGPFCADVSLRFLSRACLLVFVCSSSVRALLWIGALLFRFFALALLLLMLGYILSSVPCAACILPSGCMDRLLLLTEILNLLSFCAQMLQWHPSAQQW